MKRVLAVLALAVAAAVPVIAENSELARRDSAVTNIEVCLRTNDVFSRECKRVNQSIGTLISEYNAGDKSVLPTLLRFPHLTKFLDAALLDDPQTFLSVVGSLPEKQQSAVARGISGGGFWLRDQATLQHLMDILHAVPQNSTNRPVADRFLEALKTNNACHLVNYFPPRTFTGRSAEFETFWVSRDLYSLGEQPLWPSASSVDTTYRFTHLGAFTGPKSATLTVLPDGTGTISMKSLSSSRDDLQNFDPKIITSEQVSNFLGALKQADYWHMSADPLRAGDDGAEWILEAMQNGQYHVAVRWCPAESNDPQGKAFANAAKMLLQFAGLKHRGGC